DGLIAEGKHYFYRSEAYLLKTQLAFAEGNFKLAYKHACAGLGAVGDLGDVRVLASLYRLLAILLERDRNRVDDAHDALERSIVVGRERARRLDLALALRQCGLHLKRFANRPTLRARGSGFLFEAERLFAEMGIPAPKDIQPGQVTEPTT